MAGKKRVMQAEDLYEIRPVSDCAISPDGTAVLFTVQRVDKGSEKKYSNLWLAPTGRGEARQYTYGNQNDSSPQWSPDGREIAFLSNRGDAEKPAGLYLIPANGGEARPLTDIKGKIGSFAWSPNGKQIVCAVQKTDAEVLERQGDEAKKKLGVVARHITRVHYKFDGLGFLPKERWHLWVIDARTGRATQITDGSVHDEQQPNWSPDGQSIVFVSNRADDPDFAPDGEDLYIISAMGGEMQRVPTPFGEKSDPVFSPNGRYLAYYGRTGRGDWWKHDHLWVVPIDGSSEAQCLTDDEDIIIGNASMNDTGGCVTMSPIWSADGERIFFQQSRHGSTTLHVIDRDGSNRQTIISDEAVVGACSLDAQNSKVAYWQATMTTLGEIFVTDLPHPRSRQLSRINTPLLNKMNLGQVEEVWFKGADDNDLQGWVLKPPNFDPSQTYPSIMEIHGGPLGQYANALMHEFHFLAAHGYVVYFSNPRGGRGYGEAHARAIWNGHGTADYADVMAWADHVAQLPYIDRDRRGVTGGSYGGFMVNWIIGHTDQFRAAVTQRSISNRLSSYGSSDINWRREIAFNDEPPWENLDNYWGQSPLKYIGNAKTPTLVIHSEQDLRCPIEQGEQIYVALKRLGVDTEMVRFPDSPHGLSRVGRTDRRIVRLNHILRWFDKYLK
ncbi:MAG: S9 family peptidase [Anaerolineales bacterium]|nr:S9 family peptidase [Anaerolineales bacterium]